MRAGGPAGRDHLGCAGPARTPSLIRPSCVAPAADATPPERVGASAPPFVSGSSSEHAPLIDKARLQVLGDFDTGGQGVVKEGLLLDRDGQTIQVAVKFPKCPDERPYIMAEAGILSSINHPNIVLAYGICHLGDEEVALVLEYVGPNASKLIAAFDRGAVPEVAKRAEYAIRICALVADALLYLHKNALNGRLLVHRDIKPKNILLKLAPGTSLAVGAHTCVCTVQCIIFFSSSPQPRLNWRTLS